MSICVLPYTLICVVLAADCVPYTAKHRLDVLYTSVLVATVVSVFTSA